MTKKATKEVSGGNYNKQIAFAAQAACILEADAPKAGNVNRYYDFEDCTLEDFHLSALAIGNPLGLIKVKGVGRTILGAVEATRKFVPKNTNLGIVLLLAPLAMAWSQILVRIQVLNNRPSPDNNGKALISDMWKEEIKKVLENLTTEDAVYVYRAIRLASPGGMGEVREYDVFQDKSPQITLLEAMRMAAGRDLIALQYTNNFDQVLGVGYKTLVGTLQQGGSLPYSIAQTHLFLMKEYPDSLIKRKLGEVASQEVQQRAREVWERGGWLTAKGRKSTAEFDQWLRKEGNSRNPGALADLITAIIFVFLMERNCTHGRGIIL